MQWRQHYGLKTAHAPFGASSYHWLNYDVGKLLDVYHNQQAKERGTRLHELAKDCIELGVVQRRSKQTFCSYVNDAIGFRMTPEQVLYFSEFFWGTADAISYEKGVLRIHDLKTGTSPASMKQLYIYAALFCLEYDVKPGEIQIELRIYQNDEVFIENPGPDIIVPVMDKIVTFDKVLRKEAGNAL